MTARSALVIATLCFGSSMMMLPDLPAQQPSDRAPAVPLITHDPYFSVWSMADNLTDQNTRHWSGSEIPIDGLIRLDGTLYRYMGAHQLSGPREAIPPMHQASVQITPLHTVYRFEQSGVRLDLSFFTPSFPKDLDVLSRPVTYLSWSAQSIDGSHHRVELMLDVDPRIAINDDTQPVVWGRTRTAHTVSLNIGSQQQQEMHRSGDTIRIDWGYFHLVVPDDQQAQTALSSAGMAQFARDGSLPRTDDGDMPKPALSHGHAAHASVAFQLGSVGAQPVERHVLVAYTELHSIEYLGRKLVPYWRRNGSTDGDMFEAAESQRAELEQKGKAFDADLLRDMEKVGGNDYAYLTSLAFRQTIAAHKLVADIDGQPMLFSKENGSNGCIDTVDVTYPSSPFFLFFNPVLLQAQLEPLMRYAALPRWRFPFAPHDLGTFPLANGQVYGGAEETEENQMPVEESADLILMITAMERERGDWSFAAKYYPQLEKWAAYLADKGMDPENQLSTDDFAGHLAHNSNLSLKAIEALAAFSDLARQTGHSDVAKHYAEVVKPLPVRWMAMAKDGDHYKLAFDQPGTWSQEYNLVWDKLLHLNLFPASLAQDEWRFYATRMKPYGLPLDSRKTITKLDWEFWTATLSDDPAQFRALAATVRKWTNESRSRVPLTDYYDTVTGLQIGFQARSVVGGIFIKALADPQLAKKWLNR